MLVSIGRLQPLLDVFARGDHLVHRRPLRRHTSRYRLTASPSISTNNSIRSPRTHLQSNIVVRPEEQWDRVPLDAAPVDCPVHCGLEHAIYTISFVSYVGGSRENKCALVQRDSWSAMLTTKVPGTGGASIHWLFAFSTCSAWMSGSCHRMVKH